MILILSFSVSGLPKTQGSKRAFCLRNNGVLTGSAVVVDANQKGREWKNLVADAANQAMIKLVDPPACLLVGAIAVSFRFRMPRPKGHYGARGLKDSAPFRPRTKPDLLKLARAAEDAMTGIAYRDDSQIVIERLEKIYDPAPGLDVEIFEIENRVPEQVPEAQELLPI